MFEFSGFYSKDCLYEQLYHKSFCSPFSSPSGQSTATYLPSLQKRPKFRVSERVGAEPGLGGRQESETAGTAGCGEGDCSYSPGTGEPQQV